MAAEAHTIILNLKGSCHKIETQVNILRSKSGSSNFFQELLGLNSPEKEQQLLSSLQQVYNEEREMYLFVNGFTESLRKAINDVNNTLGPNGIMHSDNVPAAAGLLQQYSAIFDALETEAAQGRDQILELVDELSI